MNYVLCPNCQVNVGFMSCCTCHLDFHYEQCNGLPVTCPLCPNMIKLESYYQQNADVEKHRKCWRNHKRFFYKCPDCEGIFCHCVEQQLKKEFCLKECPILKKLREMREKQRA